MPNWVTNRLEIVGDVDEIRELVSSCSFPKNTVDGIPVTDDYSVTYDLKRAFVPTPHELEETPKGFFAEAKQHRVEQQQQHNIETFGYADWYDFNIAEWGSKWGDVDTTLLCHSWEYVEFHFLSAWTAPLAGIKKIANRYKQCCFILTYTEEFNQFIGGMAVTDYVDIQIEGDPDKMTQETIREKLIQQLELTIEGDDDEGY